jgi:Tfp pilus assembly protein PilO
MKPKKFFFIALGAIAVILAAAGGGYYLALTKLHTESSNEAVQLTIASQDDSQISSLHSLEYQYQRDIVPNLGLMTEALPTAKKQTEVLAQLQNVANSVGLVITTVTMPSPAGLPSAISQTITTGSVLALPISFELSGNYNALQQFTADVENLNRYTNITSISIAQPDKTKPLVYSMGVSAYIMP